MSSLKDYLKLAGKSGIAALYNDKEEWIYIFSSQDIGLYLAKLCSDAVSKKHSIFDKRKIDKSEVVILETGIDCVGPSGLSPSASESGPSPMKIREYYWYTQFKSRNYKILSKKPLTLIPYIRVLPGVVSVNLRNQAYHHFTVAEFKTMEEANLFYDKLLLDIQNGIIPKLDRNTSVRLETT